MQRTDWTAYYQQPKSRFSEYTQRFTAELLDGIIRKYCIPGLELSVLEYGGGNSCFLSHLENNHDIATYAIADNNPLAIELAKAHPAHPECYLVDALSEEDVNNIPDQYDFVYSVGLIEHFRGEDIHKVINAHFAKTKPGAIVTVTFPTPTVKYRICRKLMELLRVWQFYDESPLRWEDVSSWFNENGEVLEHFVNRKLPLTQMVVVVRSFTPTAADDPQLPADCSLSSAS